MEYDSDLLTLNELCNTLSISIATGRNWLRLKKLIPTKTINSKPYFSHSYVNQFKTEIASGKNTALKSRRNKRFVSGNGIYHSYISPTSPNNTAVRTVLDILMQHNTILTEQQISLVVAECALQLICQKEQIASDTPCNLLHKYFSTQLDIGIYHTLIDDFVTASKEALSFMEKLKSLFAVSYTYESQEDILGLLYISLKNIGSRKATGSYYTPTQTVQQLIANLTQDHTDVNGKTILDPCCGTGNFLLQLPDTFDISQIYGNDIDKTSVMITRLNLALKFHIQNMELLYKNITVSNFLTTKNIHTYDFIIGNPPWGYSFSNAEKKQFQTTYQCAHGKSIESYDLFIERALSLLKENGTLSFVLPKAILNVKSHTPIREIILKENSITRLEFLGDTFDKVQCPSIILQIVHTKKPLSCMGMTVTDETRSFVIQKERALTSDYFSFLMDDREYKIMEKIRNLSNQTTLKNQADFALGIVTGNNKKYISNTKTVSTEIILRGSDINRYQIKEPENFITFTPEEFQQVASEKYYRAPEKLFYRFICNEPVFAYDDKQTLSLNSCNIVIPHVKGLDMKYILAILNSRITQFIFKKQFDSVKILRSHIEQLPIPIVDFAVQEKIIAMVNTLLQETDDTSFLAHYNKLEQTIIPLFGLNSNEYEIICNSLTQCDDLIVSTDLTD